MHSYFGSLIFINLCFFVI